MPRKVAKNRVGGGAHRLRLGVADGHVYRGGAWARQRPKTTASAEAGHFFFECPARPCRAQQTCRAQRKAKVRKKKEEEEEDLIDQFADAAERLGHGGGDCAETCI